jgi:hypothetical protein
VAGDGVDEARFGAPAPASTEPIGSVVVGAQVRVVTGRHRGATAEVVALETVPTPSGRGARMALIRRPRAGESWEFVTDLAPLA